MRAAFTVEQHNEHMVVIRDQNGPTSVTNAAEQVVADLHRRGLLTTQKLYYYDSEGQFDELQHDEHGKFVGFAPGPHRKESDDLRGTQKSR